MSITPYYFSLIDKQAFNNDPIYLQSVPSSLELETRPYEMADPLAESGVFPAMVCQMISVGESTGALDAMLEKIADFYEEEVDQAVDNLTSLIEPFMLVFLGVVIGTLVVAMYMPIFKMAGAL